MLLPHHPPPLRHEWHVPDAELNAPLGSEEPAPPSPLREPANGNANVTSSALVDLPGWHSPVLDIDFPARLVPSSTPGHFHLYLDGLAIDWARYEPLLNALAEAGVVGKGYVARSIERGQSVVRLPHSRKPAPVTP